VNAHTHHITLVDADVAPIANGFQVTGIATITLSGRQAPAAVNPSMVVINITGGAEGRIFQYHTDSSVAGLQPFWTRAPPDRSSKRQGRKVKIAGR
jgi:hypothetical protein